MWISMKTLIEFPPRVLYTWYDVKSNKPTLGGWQVHSHENGHKKETLCREPHLCRTERCKSQL